jgi:hypothetical protein
MRPDINELIMVIKQIRKPRIEPPIHLFDGSDIPVLIMPHPKRDRERMNVEKKRNVKHIQSEQSIVNEL